MKASNWKLKWYKQQKQLRNQKGGLYIFTVSWLCPPFASTNQKAVHSHCVCVCVRETCFISFLTLFSSCSSICYDGRISFFLNPFDKNNFKKGRLNVMSVGLLERSPSFKCWASNFPLVNSQEVLRLFLDLDRLKKCFKTETCSLTIMSIKWLLDFGFAFAKKKEGEKKQQARFPIFPCRPNQQDVEINSRERTWR